MVDCTGVPLKKLREFSPSERLPRRQRRKARAQRHDFSASSAHSKNNYAFSG
jgi:hypothetical protein